MCERNCKESSGFHVIYAMGDIHGCYSEFLDALSLIDLSEDNKLVLLGDYIHGHIPEESYQVLDKIIDLEKEYGTEKVIVLMGNHERFITEEGCGIGTDRSTAYLSTDRSRDEKYLSWLSHLRRYYETEKQIFVHAGIEEEAEDWWRWGTPDLFFTDKFPAETGHFLKDIIAGHVPTSSLAGNPHFHNIYFDGESHYFCDGSAQKTGIIPVLKYNTKTGAYFQAGKNGDIPILPYYTYTYN